MKNYKGSMITSLRILILCSLLLNTKWALSKDYLNFGYAKNVDTLNKTFQILINDQAKTKNAFIDFQFVSQDGQPIPNVKYLLNDKRVNENFIRIWTGEATANKVINYKISVVFDEQCKQGNFKGYFKLINATPGLEYNDKLDSVISRASVAIPVTWKYNIPWTILDYSLKIFLPFIFIIFVSWFTLLRTLLYAKFTSGYIEFIAPALPRIALKGKRRVYLGGKVRKTQGKLGKFFAGEILIINPDLPINVEFYPFKSRGKVYCRYSSDAETSIDPYIDQLCDQDELTISNPELGSKYKLTYLNSKQPRIN